MGKVIDEAEGLAREERVVAARAELTAALWDVRQLLGPWTPEDADGFPDDPWSYVRRDLYADAHDVVGAWLHRRKGVWCLAVESACPVLRLGRPGNKRMPREGAWMPLGDDAAVAMHVADTLILLTGEWDLVGAAPDGDDARVALKYSLHIPLGMKV